MKLSRRWFLGLLLLSACGVKSGANRGGTFTVGAVSYGEGSKALDRYDRFKRFLSEKTGSVVEFEPAFNENKALERIQNQAWTLVFAPPGLAAIAMSQHQYSPLFPLTGVQNLRSVLVVREDSDIQRVAAIAGKSVVLGQPGSATGYYLPLFNLYGLMLSELLLAPTPKAVLEAVAQEQAAVGALSVEEFDTYKSQVSQSQFRILFTDAHSVPSGVVLISPSLERNRQEAMRNMLSQTPSDLSGEAGFVPNAPVPNYEYMISVVERVRSIFPSDTDESLALLHQKPVRIFKK